MLMAAWLLIPIAMVAQTYSAMWKQVEAAQEKDLPETAITHLQKIEKKARQERAYGQLLKAALMTAKLQNEISSDSLAPAVNRLEQQTAKANDMSLQAVYATALSEIYDEFDDLEESESKSTYYRKLALAHPEILGKTSAGSYEPFIVKGKDSEVFDHDLLSVIGMELDAWQWMTDYYEKVGNCRAACLTAIHTKETIEGIDSLIAIYGDYDEAGELAIRRYELMQDKNCPVAEKYQWLQESLQRWGGWKRVGVLKEHLSELTFSNVQLEIPSQVYEVNKPQTVRFTELRNLKQLTMRVYRTALKGNTDASAYSIKEKDLVEVKEAARTVTFAPHAEYEYFKDSVDLMALPAGVYLISISTNPKIDKLRNLYYVSSVRLLNQGGSDKIQHYVAVDATTGQPIAGAKMRLVFARNGKKTSETKILTCNQQGEATYDCSKQNPQYIFVYTDDDDYCPDNYNHGYYSYHDRQYNQQRTNIFTDRSIYRPGQTVHATAIVWKEVSATEMETVADKKVKLELRDANYKVVAEKEVTTDRYGKCSTTFTLPTGKLNGRFSIRTSNASVSFRVEEYKRPAFQVEFDEYKESYQAGDTVRAKAKAMSYAGVPVQNGMVHYTVKRRIAYWWMTFSRYWQSSYIGNGLSEVVLSEGDATTNDDGSFGVDIPLTMPDGLGRHSMFYNFVVEADVTDQAGETHHGTLSLPLGNKSTTLGCDLPEQVRADQMPSVTFHRRNAAGKEIPGMIRYRIDGGKWKECSANVQCSIFNAQLKSGKHTIQAICLEDSLEQSFVVFSLEDKRPATETHDWFYVSHEEFPADGSPVTLQVGSSDSDLYIVYGLFAGNREIERGVVKKNAALLNRQFTYREEYGNGLLLTYAWVKDGKCYKHEQFIRRPMPDKQLRMKWETFRDRLIPGQKEEWKLTITKPDGTPADASLLAVLYDKSLDALTKHQWLFTPKISLSQPYAAWQWNGELYLEDYADNDNTKFDKTVISYSHFDYNVYPNAVILRSNGMVPGVRVALDSRSRVKEDTSLNEVVVLGYGVQKKSLLTGTITDITKEPEPEQVQVRENLNETAFCYPNIITDKDGNATLKFTLPESLTTWRFMGLANTTDMMYGSLEGEIVAQKDVMIQPNMPRFIREGDKATISARLFNTTDHSVSGTAKIQLIDPETEKVVYEQEQPFTIDANGSASSMFNVQCSMFNASLLICKVIAKGEGFSDGEQHYLPILPDKEYVTKTVPYTQHEPGVKTIDLSNLFPQETTQQKLTVEYTNNPAWLMVQSLPTLGQPYEHSAIDQAASYYSNLLAKSLLNQSPQVKSVFEQWKREENSNLSSLTSQLNKNEDLKDLILAETPWVNAADRETEQKQRLADFFDENGINNRLETALEKLTELQNSDGSFSWYPGMEGSTMVTMAIEEMLARLQTMASSPLTTNSSTLYNKAFNYLGREMTEMVDRMKKEEKKGRRQTFPSFTALRWLYLCAIDGRQLSAKVKSANDYLTALLKKDIKNQSIYEKAMTAVVLAKRGEKTKAAEYVKSLKEYSVYTEEMGRYYDTRRAFYSWYDYKIPTEVAAMEAIQLVTPQDKQTVDEMRRWLLQEKRTQVWDTPINSVNAIYAFLNGQQSLTTQHAQSVLAIDGTPIETSKATAGIGYVKTAITEPKGKTFTATKTSEGTSWGAVYAQFFQKTSDIENAQSGIKVKREVLVSTNTSDASRTSQTSATSLKVGDRIKVRITIETSRDLDFVQVVDKRACCMEPVRQLSGYHNGAYVSPKDYATHYFYRGLGKGKHVIETEYYIDRAGTYETGTCSVGCAYAPEYRATAGSITFNIAE